MKTKPRLKWSPTRPEHAVRRLQSEKLRRYLRDVVLPFSPRYRELFREHGLSADSIRSLDDLGRIPLTSKADLLNTPEHPQRARDFLITPDQHVLSRRARVVLRALTRGRSRVQQEMESEYRPLLMTTTTGRSAEPVPFLFTRHDLANLAVTGRRLFEVCGAQREWKLLNMFPYAPHLAFWQTHYGAEAFGVFMISTGGGKVLGTEGQLRFIRKVQPDVLIGMPTFVYHVLHEAAETGLRCETLKRLVLGGEKVPAGMRRKLVALAGELGAREVDVVGTYGFTECKMAFAECPRPVSEPSCGYHLHPDLGIMEVVDPVTGEVQPPESPGELVFTPLDARGTVVLRYRTGDVIDGGLTYAPCPGCGRQVPRLLGNISRRTEIREMRVDKLKGTLVDFNELEHILDDCAQVQAWQIELRKRHDDPLEVDELILHVSAPSGIVESQIARELSARFAERTEIQPNRVEFHTLDEMRELQGVGREMKECRLVDHRPPAAPAPGPAVSAASTTISPVEDRRSESMENAT